MYTKNRKAVSPVIATVILVAVAITISVAVAYWMGGISSQYTKFEKVEVSNAIISTPAAGTWNIQVTLKNTGTSSATINDVFINDRPLAKLSPPVALAGNGAWDNSVTTIASGATLTIDLQVMNGGATTQPFYALSAGTTINMKFHSAGGMDYLKLIELV